MNRFSATFSATETGNGTADAAAGRHRALHHKKWPERKDPAYFLELRVQKAQILGCGCTSTRYLGRML